MPFHEFFEKPMFVHDESRPARFVTFPKYGDPDIDSQILHYDSPYYRDPQKRNP